MPVHRPQIVESHGTEHVDREQLVLHLLLQVVIEGIDRRHPHEHVPVPALEADIPRPDPHSLQEPGRAAHIGVDGHVVVVQDNDHGFPACRRGREALIGKPARERPVPDHGDDVIVLAQQRPGLRHAHRHGDRVGGVPRDKGVVLALIGFREARQAAVLPQRVEAVPPSGDDLVGIALVAHVEDDAVLFGVVDAVQRQRQLHSAEIGRQVPAGFGYRLHQKAAQLPGELVELFLRKALDVQ